MITVVTSIHQKTREFIDVYIKSILKTELVTECILVVTDRSLEESVTYQRGIRFRTVRLPENYPFRLPGEPIPVGAVQTHGYGLSYGASLATQEYVMFLDHDVYFYKAVDKIFHSLMQKYSLNVVGISHFSPTTLVMHYFPTVICMLVKKEALPGPEYLQEIKQISPFVGDLLSPPGPDFELAIRNGTLRASVPGPEKIFDTGTLLYFWSLKNNWRWMSFQTRDALNYDLGFSRGNFDECPKLKNQHFLYHESNKKYEVLREVSEKDTSKIIFKTNFEPSDISS